MLGLVQCFVEKRKTGKGEGGDDGLGMTAASPPPSPACGEGGGRGSERDAGWDEGHTVTGVDFVVEGVDTVVHENRFHLLHR